MATLRILFLGFGKLPEKRDDEHFDSVPIEFSLYTYDFAKPLPALYDYHIVVLSDLVKQIPSYKLEKLKGQFEKLLLAPFHGVVITTLHDSLEYYSWCPIKPRIVSARGSSIEVQKSHWVAPLLEKFKSLLYWVAHGDFTFSELRKEDKRLIAATNISDNPICFEGKFGKGTILYLPCINAEEETRLKFYRELLDKIKENLLKKEYEIPPTWLSQSQYTFDRERILEQEIEKYRDELSLFEKARNILWKSGSELTYDIATILEQLDLSIKVVEKEGRHDIEIVEKELHAIAEIKGLKKSASVDDLRQLEDWVAEKIKEDENIKGVFIVNHYKDLSLEQRGDPFTIDAERIAKRNQYCLMTTQQLFDAFKLKLAGKFDKNLFITKIKECNGVFKL